MPTRNVVLTDHHQEMIERLVKAGRYQNASEVLRDGLRMVEQREEVEAAKLTALRDAAQLGFSDLDAGRFTTVRIDDLDEYISNLGKHARHQAFSPGVENDG